MPKRIYKYIARIVLILLLIVTPIWWGIPTDSYDVCEQSMEQEEVQLNNQAVAIMVFLGTLLGASLIGLFSRKCFKNKIDSIAYKLTKRHLVATISATLLSIIVLTPMSTSLMIIFDNLGFVLDAWILFSVLLCTRIVSSTKLPETSWLCRLMHLSMGVILSNIVIGGLFLYSSDTKWKYAFDVFGSWSTLWLLGLILHLILYPLTAFPYLIARQLYLRLKG